MKSGIVAFLAATSAFTAPALAQTVGADIGDDDVNSEREIVVTANRRVERLQDVPLSIAAVSGDTLAASGVSDTQGLEQVVPGLVMGQSGPSAQPTIRGIGTRGGTPGEESNVAMYIDGVYQPAMSSNNFELLNIERVEVLKGPQGTLYGRNATGGAINIVTTKPGDELVGRVSLSYGRFDEVDAALYTAVPVNDVISADVAFRRINRDGYIDDLLTGEKLGDRKSTNLRARLRLRPSDTLDVIVAFSRNELDDGSVFAVQPVNGNTVGRRVDPNVLLPNKPWQYVGNRKPEFGSEQTDWNLLADLDLGFAVLQSVTDYQKNTSYFRSDSDGSELELGGIYSPDTYTDAFSQELRLISQDIGRLQWIVGGLYFDSESAHDPMIIDTATLSGITRNGVQDSKAWSGYAEGTLEAVDDMFVTAGIRYSNEKRTFTLASGASQSASFEDWTPRVSLRYEVSSNASIYATWAQGFKSGLFNGASSGFELVAPETITSYEAGIKLSPARWLRTTLAAYLYDYQDLQVQARLAGDDVARLQNAGKARVKGIDFDATLYPMGGLTISLAASYIDAKFREFEGASINVPTTVDGVAVGGNTGIIADVTGNRLVRAPELTVSTGFNYAADFAGGVLKLGGNVAYNDGYFLELGNRLRQPSYTLINGSLGFWNQKETLGLTFWIENAADEAIVQWPLSSGSQDGYSYRAPQTYGVRLNGSF